jgi:membrane protease YdiL (CAAX protease family)
MPESGSIPSSGPITPVPAPTRQRNLIRRFPLGCYFLLAYAISWVAWLPYLLSDDGVGLLHFNLGSPYLSQLVALPGAYLGPLSAAFIVTAATEGRTGLRRWRHRLLKWRVDGQWYLLAVIGVPTVLILGTLALPGAASQIRFPTAEALALYLPFLVFQVLTTGIAEEPGWRDFALPRIQQRFGPLTGTLILGPLWAAWHLPLFLTQWALTPLTPLSFAQFAMMSVVFSITITWIFNRCGQSLPIAMLVHASHNNLFSVLWSDIFPHLEPAWNQLNAAIIAYAVIAVLIILTTRGRLGYHTDTAAPTPPAIEPSYQ